MERGVADVRVVKCIRGRHWHVQRQAIHIREPRTAAERIGSHLTHALRNGERCQRITAIEGICTDGGNVLGKRHRGKVAATHEGIVIDARQPRKVLQLIERSNIRIVREHLAEVRHRRRFLITQRPVPVRVPVGHAKRPHVHISKSNMVLVFNNVTRNKGNDVSEATPRGCAAVTFHRRCWHM